MIAWKSFFESITDWTPYVYVDVHSYAQKILTNFAADRSGTGYEPQNIFDQFDAGKAIAESMTAQHNVQYTG